MRKLNNIMITGGAGFIGSNFIRSLFARSEFKGIVINVDKLTYAGNPLNLSDVSNCYRNRYFFEKADTCNKKAIRDIFRKYNIDTIVHFAAETHVDRSIFSPKIFIDSNVYGTFTLLEVARLEWHKRNDVLFHHISTDEVYGSLDESGYFFEHTGYNPKSPYSASKAASDHLVRSYYHTYELPVTLSICSNNYGPYQFPEKLIPFMILNIIEEKPLPLYGDGKNIRNWLYVEDHNTAVWLIMNKGRVGESYNISGENEWENIQLVDYLCEKFAKITGKSHESYKKLITFVKDRPGHDRRYAINCDKIKHNLGWKQSIDLEKGLEKTIKWYLNNLSWVNNIKNDEYMKWVKINYLTR